MRRSLRVGEIRRMRMRAIPGGRSSQQGNGARLLSIFSRRGNSMRKDDVKAFKEQKASLLEELRNLGAAADVEAEKRSTPGQWTAEEQERFDKVETEIRSLNERIERGIQMYSHEK